MNGKKEKYKWINIVFLAVLLLLLVSVLVFRSGMFAGEPKVTAVADNCYDETLTVITDEDYSPYSFYDKDGNYSGHDVELIILVANELHMNLDLKLMSWDEGIAEITAGNADVLMTCDYSDSFEGVDRLEKSEPVSTDDFLVYSKERITTSDVLYGKRIAVMKNGNVTGEIKKMQLSDYCVGYDNNRQAMQALIDGDVDFAVMRQTVGTVLLKELNASGIEGYVSIGRSDMCFGINSSDPELTGEINAALEKIKRDGELERLRDKWLTTFIKPYTLTETLINNIWFVFAFLVLVAASLAVSVRNKLQRQRIEEDEFRSIQVIEQLAQDFECVNFVELKDSAEQDTVVNYRVSDKLKSLIPGWEEEKYFLNKLKLLGKTIVYEPDLEQFFKNTRRDRILEAFKESDVYFVDVRLFIEDDIRYYQMKFSPVYEEKKLKGIVVGLHSVDERTKREKALQKQLQDALAGAEAANKSKTDFLFNMSHDIRTPMNAVLGFTGMAEKHIDDKEKVLSYLQKTQKSGNLLLSLINSILDVSRIESGKAVLEENAADVYDSFSAITDTMQELAAAKNIDLIFEVNGIKDRYIYCDLNRCNRVFVNIVSNSIKYSNEGSSIRVSCKQLGNAGDGWGSYCYTFEDNGIGMTEEFQKHVFDRFSREETSTVSGIQGTGLGMTVCKSFVDLMGGTIECRSTLGKGTTFTVTLPFRLQDAKCGEHPLQGENVAFSAEPYVDCCVALKGKTVLLTEDNELNREIAEDILKEEGLVVETACDGSEAVRLLQEKGPGYYDFILMDIQMPVMNGYEATKAIREMYPESHIPIIALSANAFAEDKASSLAAGMDDHVAKPIDMKQLFGTLSKYL